MIVFRSCDPRFLFLWDWDHGNRQTAGRWNTAGGEPVHYFSDTVDGAWAEALRHANIRTEGELLEDFERDLWAVDLPDAQVPTVRPELPRDVLQGGMASYPQCQAEAERLRGLGARGLRTSSAALLDAEANGWRVDWGLKPGPDRNGETIVVFGLKPDLVGWCACDAGRPDPVILSKVRYF